MKDRVFEAADRDAALAAASATLGVPVEALRYVVLAEAPGKAQVAVLGGVTRPIPVAAPRPAPADPPAGVRALLGELKRAADLDVDVEIEVGEGRLLARLVGADVGFFTDRDGAALGAFEYLLQRIYGDAVAGTILLDADGLRERREERLRQAAAELIAAVRGDGEARATEPLNSYERRIVHMAVSEQPGIRSWSEGRGPRRRVWIETEAAEPA